MARRWSMHLSIRHGDHGLAYLPPPWTGSCYGVLGSFARPSSRLLTEILWLQFDGGAVGCAVGGAPPGIAVTRELPLVAQTLVGD